MARPWVKLHCDNWIEGSLRQEKPALRGVFADLLALCGRGQYSSDGQIKVQNGLGYPPITLCKVLNIAPKMWRSCRKRLIETDRIEVDVDNIIAIKNWKRYQSEYERQKPQRMKGAAESATKGAAESAAESATLEGRGESIDYRVEKEIAQERFNTFWKAYPKKQAKVDAEKAFKKINPDEQFFAMMLEAIEKAKKQELWQKINGKYIPLPATWLNGKRWEDEFGGNGHSYGKLTDNVKATEGR